MRLPRESATVTDTWLPGALRRKYSTAALKSGFGAKYWPAPYHACGV